MKSRYAVYGRNNSAPLFTGSKTECLRFMAFALTGGAASLTIQWVKP